MGDQEGFDRWSGVVVHEEASLCMFASFLTQSN